MHCSSEEEAVHRHQAGFHQTQHEHPQMQQHKHQQEQQCHHHQRDENQQAESPVTSSSQASSSAAADSTAAAASSRVACAHFTAEHMDIDCREVLRRHFEERINRKSKYELVAAFTVIEGEILAYTAYRERAQQAFQLTERRRRLIRTYYRSGEHNLLLYENSAGSEHYMPLGYVTRDCSHQRRLRRRFQEASAALALTADATSGGFGATLLRLVSG